MRVEVPRRTAVGRTRMTSGPSAAIRRATSDYKGPVDSLVRV
jgi:hypothetical protein